MEILYWKSYKGQSGGSAGVWPFRFMVARGRHPRGLPSMVLFLLSSSPKNGVELMDGVEELTHGHWRPTPGSIYPLLKFLTEDGMVRKLADNRYELTEKGRGQAEESFGKQRRRARTTGEVLSQMDNYVSFLEDTKRTAADELPANAAKIRGLARRLNGLLGDDQDAES